MTKDKKRWPIPATEYGPVLITKGVHRGRIGDYDNDADDPFRGVVYFGGIFQSSGYYLIDKRYFKEPTINDLITRYQKIQSEIFGILGPPNRKGRNYKHLSSIVAEGHYVYCHLEARNLKGKYGTSRRGKSIYMAHSSKDKGLVRRVHDDLKELGHKPWLDENNIRVVLGGGGRASDCGAACSYGRLCYPSCPGASQIR